MYSSTTGALNSSQLIGGTPVGLYPSLLIEHPVHTRGYPVTLCVLNSDDRRPDAARRVSVLAVVRRAAQLRLKIYNNIIYYIISYNTVTRITNYCVRNIVLLCCRFVTVGPDTNELISLISVLAVLLLLLLYVPIRLLDRSDDTVYSRRTPYTVTSAGRVTFDGKFLKSISAFLKKEN